ncbi:hypothetical protein [Paenibacillus silvae]|uniref:hypothetical protein n=1 Tax=Paenibacillus silvae TaxID=1325358 RepID=UPI00142DB3AC|nr:hypothetical protein [Paenibacillus silvae]
MINALASLLLPIPSLRWLPLAFPNDMKETCGQGAVGKSLKAVHGSEKSVDGALGAAG